MTTMNPYAKTGSVAYKTFEMAKAGTTRAALVAMFTKEDVGPARLLRELKLQDFRNMVWDYTESEDGKVKITNVREKGAAKTKSASKVKVAAKPAPKAVVKKVAPKVAAKPAPKAAPKAAPKKAAVKAAAPKAEAAPETETK